MSDEPCPKPGEIRVIDGRRLRFIEREIEGDKWEILEASPPHPGLRESEGESADIAWLKSQKTNGHCGEGTLERRMRDDRNDRIDRLVSALSEAQARATEGGWKPLVVRLTKLANGLAMSAKLEREFADELAGDPQFATIARTSALGLQTEADDIREAIDLLSGRTGSGAYTAEGKDTRDEYSNPTVEGEGKP